MPDMHAAVTARSTMQHRHKRVGELEERALINLPFPIPSIPILDPLLKPLAPLLTPLIDGTHPETRTKTTSTTPTARTTSTTPTQAPAPTPTPTTPASSPTSPSTGNPSSGGGGNSSGNSGSSSPGNSGGSPNDGSSSGGSPNTGSGSGGSSGGSNGNGGGSGGNSDPATPGGTVNNPGGVANPTGTASNVPGATGVSGSGVSIPGSFVLDPSSAGAGSDGSSGAANGGSAGAAAGSNLSAVVNANGAAFVSGTTAALAPGETANVGTGTFTTTSANAAATDSTGRTVGAKGGSPTGSDSGSTSSTTHADPSNPSAMSDASVHHGLSSGIIVAICVILGMLALLFLAFCCRRRAIAKRLRRRRTWFAAGAYRGGSSEEYTDGTRSARSSFATHYDRGDMLTPAPQIDLSVASAEMSQVWPSNMSGSITIPSASRTVESHPSPTIRAAPDRSSLSSLSSGGSRPPSQTSQYLAAPDAAAVPGSPFGADFPSPFSVRPFSPSETFSFPRPPQDDARSRASGMMTGSVVSGSISGGSIHSGAFYTAEEHPHLSEHDHEHASMHASVEQHEPEPAENPFLDFTEIRSTSPSPSADASVELSAESASLHFAATETIRRPFVPTMEDEMAVAPGQEVRILRRFDDGWAYAELLATGVRGLIPIDTLRPVEEDLPAFLAKKRLSSYGARASQRASAFSGFSGLSVGKAM